MRDSSVLFYVPMEISLRQFHSGKIRLRKKIASPGGNNLDFPKGKETKGVKLLCHAYGILLGATSGYQSEEKPDESSELHRCFYPLLILTVPYCSSLLPRIIVISNTCYKNSGARKGSFFSRCLFFMRRIIL